MKPRLKMRLGDLLVQESIITEEQLQQALAEQRKTGHKLGRTLIDRLPKLNYCNFCRSNSTCPYSISVNVRSPLRWSI